MTFRSLLLSCLCITPAFAQTDWSTALPASPGQQPNGELVELETGRILWLNREGPSVVLDASLAVSRFADLGNEETDGRPIATPDGGLLQLDQVADRNLNSCQVLRFDAQLRLRWRENLASRNRVTGCDGVALDGAGQVWAIDFGLFRLAYADGVQRTQVPVNAPDIDLVTSIVTDPAAPGVYAKVTFIEASGTDSEGAVRLAGDGSLIWEWRETMAGRSYFQIQRSDAGELYLIGSGQLAVLDAAGSLRWRFADVAADQLSELAVGKDGTVLVHTRTLDGSAPATLRLLAADGQELWRQTRTTGARFGEVQLRNTAGGLLVYEESIGFDGQLTFNDDLQRLDLTGRSIWQRRLDGELAQLILRADGQVVALENFRRVDVGLVKFAAADGARTAIEFNRMPLDQPFPTTAAIDASGRYAVVSAINSGDYTLALLSPDGSLKWRQTAVDERYSAVSLARADRACAVRTSASGASFECRRDSDGALLWERQVVSDKAVSLYDYVALADGRQSAVLIVGSLPAITPQLVIVDPEGQLLLQSQLSTSSLAFSRYRQDGELLLSVFINNSLQRRAADGSLRFELTARALGVALGGFPLSNGESLVYVDAGSAETQRFQLLLLEADGRVRWRQPAPEGWSSNRLEVIEQAGDLVLADIGSSGLDVPFDPALVRLRRSDGSSVWQQRLPSLSFFNRNKSLVLDNSGQSLAFVSLLRDSIEVQLVAPADGRLLAQRVVALAPASETVLARLNASGQLRIASVQDPADSGARVHVDAKEQVFTLRSDSSIDRVARSGAWFDAVSSGQGWFFDVIPASRTIYAAWFTYERREAAPMATPARLRWFSLQGTYEPGADSVALDILENRDGAFATPPVTTARKVGTANLRFDGCGTGVLDYVFDVDENGGSENRVALRALAIRDPACPAGPSEVVAAGLNSASSGAWFDPGPGGQGLVGVVQPPAAGSEGLLFAGWFHYDPAGQADDDRQQAWLTLQGALATGSNGTAEVGIFRTLGGQFAGPPTPNTTRIGTATVVFEACDRMRLSYRFDAGADAAPYSGIQGSQQLVKIGGCARP